MQDFSWFNALSPAAKQLILEGPALLPPHGELSMFDDPPNMNSLAWGIIVSSMIISTIVVFLRLYARFVYHQSIHIEDGIALLAFGVFCGFAYCYLRMLLHPGFFIHMWHVRFKELPHILYYLSVGSITYAVTIALIKIGILIEWARIFVPTGTRNTFWWTCYIALATNAVFFTTITFIEIFGCRPREKLWNVTIPGKCLDVPKVTWVGAIVNFFSDIIILLLPQRIIWSLHMSAKKKLAVAAMFAVGILSCVCAGFRINSALEFAQSDDVLYRTADQGSWAIAECVLGFFIFCVPSLSKIFRNSPVCQAIASTLGFSSHRPKKQSDEVGHVLTIGRCRRPQKNDSEELFTDSGLEDCISLNNVCAVSKSTVHTEVERNGSV